jgi:hypothetical protein
MDVKPNEKPLPCAGCGGECPKGESLCTECREQLLNGSGPAWEVKLWTNN